MSIWIISLLSIGTQDDGVPCMFGSSEHVCLIPTSCVFAGATVAVCGAALPAEAAAARRHTRKREERLRNEQNEKSDEKQVRSSSVRNVKLVRGQSMTDLQVYMHVCCRYEHWLCS